MQTFAKLTTLLFFVSTILQGQDSGIHVLTQGELKMTFPSIYFKHNSTDYASMPYSADSAFKYIALHFNDNIVSLVIWRDSMETEELTNKRSRKLKAELGRIIRTSKLEIHSMGEKQKISRRTIEIVFDSTKINYLLSLNSVFDISKTHFITENKSTKKGHIDRPRIWCLNCWKKHRFSKEYRQLHVKKKDRRRLVWTGWKTGFHFTTIGKSKNQ